MNIRWRTLDRVKNGKISQTGFLEIFNFSCLYIRLTQNSSYKYTNIYLSNNADSALSDVQTSVWFPKQVVFEKCRKITFVWFLVNQEAHSLKTLYTWKFTNVSWLNAITLCTWFDKKISNIIQFLENKAMLFSKKNFKHFLPFHKLKHLNKENHFESWAYTFFGQCS